MATTYIELGLGSGSGSGGGGISPAVTGNRALVSDATGAIITASAVTATELSYLSGVTSNVQAQINAAGGVSSRQDIVGGGNSNGSHVIAVTNTSAVVSVVLLTNDMNLGSVSSVWLVSVKDESGGAGTNNITVSTQGAETIDGQNTVTLSANYAVVRMYSNGTGWFTL